ncbi:unnamed protein product [Cochlearia groenlandica]
MSSSSNSTPNHDEPDMGMAIGYPVTSPYGSNFTRNTSYGLALGTPLVTHNYNHPTLPRLNDLGLSFGPFPSRERPGGSSRYSSLFNGGVRRGTMNMYVDMTMVPPSVPYGSFTENTNYGSSSSRDPLPSPHGLSLELSLGPSNYVRSNNNNNTSVNPSLFRGGANRGTRDMTMVPSLAPHGSSSRDLLPPHGLSLELSLGPSNHIGSNININNNTSVNPSLFHGGVSTRETRNMTMVRSSAPYGSFTDNTSYGSSSRSPFPSYNFSPHGLSLEGPSNYIRSNNNFYYSSSFDGGVTRETRDMNMVPSLLPYFSFIENYSYAYSFRDHLPSYNYIPYGLSNELYLQPSNHIGGNNNNNISNVYTSLFELYLQPSNRIGGNNNNNNINNNINNISNVYTSLFNGGVIEENMGMDLSLCPLVPPYNFYSGNPFESIIGEVPLSCPPTPTNSLCGDENVLGSGYSENIIPQGETNVIVVQNDDEVNMVNDEDNMVNDEDNMVNGEEDMVNDEDNGED